MLLLRGSMLPRGRTTRKMLRRVRLAG
jgi:hypothetical protein